jgi:hypothetical protein
MPQNKCDIGIYLECSNQIKGTPSGEVKLKINRVMEIVDCALHYINMMNPRTVYDVYGSSTRALPVSHLKTECFSQVTSPPCLLPCTVSSLELNSK